MARSSLFNNFFNKFNSSKKVSSAPRTLRPQGTSGTEIYAGRFDEEYLVKLLDEQGIEAFDKMRRSDGNVKQLLSAVKNPIKSAKWSVPAVDESDEEMEIAAFSEHILFNDMVTKNGKRTTFVEFLSEALTCIDFGHSVFEVVHKVVKENKQFGDYIERFKVLKAEQKARRERLAKERGY